MKEPRAAGTTHSDTPASRVVFPGIVFQDIIDVSAEEIRRRVVEAMDRVFELDDDRLLVLVGALLVENSLDRLLGAFMPGYRQLRDKREFSFSVRIELARALRLCPDCLFNCTDVVRSIRNDFVHELSTDSFARLKRERVQSMRDHVSNFSPDDVLGETDAMVFKILVTYLVAQLELYRLHIEWLNEFIRSEEFGPLFTSFCERRGLVQSGGHNAIQSPD